MHNILPIESIQERDIDLLLLEELNCNAKFCKWFVNSLSLPLFSKTNEALRYSSSFSLSSIKHTGKGKQAAIHKIN